MSTLQHTIQPALRHPRMLVATLAAALATVAVVLIISAGSSSSVVSQPTQAEPTQAQLQQQLQAVSSPRYGLSGLKPPTAATVSTSRISPERQLQAVAGARYHQPATWANRQR